MSISIKVCDSFLDVSVYCKTTGIVYGEFLNLCLQQKNRKRSFVIMTTHGDSCLIACCKDFLKTMIKDLGLNKIKLLLLSDCFYSSGFDSDTGDIVLCIQTNFHKQNIGNLCFSFQRIILKSFSEELHHIVNMS